MTPPPPRMANLASRRLFLPVGLLIVGLGLIAAIAVSAISVTTYATPGFSACLACHGEGRAAIRLEPKIAFPERQCIEPREYMRARHADLLAEWKESVVRRGQRTYIASDGRRYEMSLTRTCLACHQNKAEFCDQCHSYAIVKYAQRGLECWACHISPETAPPTGPTALAKCSGVQAE